MADDRSAVVDAYFEAFEAKDFERLETEVFSKNVEFRHHNRALEADSARDLVALLTHLGNEVWPDRRYSAIHERHAAGDREVVQSTFEATPTQDMPGLASEGEPVKLDICTVFTVDGGRITAWHDYG